MTDALCGPSNALQSFQKHASTDRSLQQDRLALRNDQQLSQGFRSQANANAGLLDPEFEAFQAGAPLAPGAPLDFQHPPQGFSQPHPFHAPQQASNGWASDFAQMHISTPPPAPAAFQNAPQTMGSWQQDFTAQFNQSHAASRPGIPQQQPSFNTGTPSFNYQRPMGYMPPPSYLSSEPQAAESRWKGKGRWQQEDTFDKDAFEREFEAMTTETLRSEDRYMGMDETNQAANVPITESEYAAGMEQAEARIKEMVAERDQQPMSVDPLHEVEPTHHHDPEQEVVNERNPAETDEDLARTAGVLLDQVSSDTSEKFAQSDFLALMRQFRDREKRIDGNKVVDAEAEPEPRPVGADGLQDADVTRNGPAEFSMTGALDPPSYKTDASVPLASQPADEDTGQA